MTIPAITKGKPTVMRENTPTKTVNAIQQAVASKMWVIILWHRVDEIDPNTGAPNPISVSSAVIQGVVNYIVQNGVHVVTDSEGLVVENLNAQQ